MCCQVSCVSSNSRGQEIHPYEDETMTDTTSFRFCGYPVKKLKDKEKLLAVVLFNKQTSDLWGLLG